MQSDKGLVPTEYITKILSGSGSELVLNYCNSHQHISQMSRFEAWCTEHWPYGRNTIAVLCVLSQEDTSGYKMLVLLSAKHVLMYYRFHTYVK